LTPARRTPHYPLSPLLRGLLKVRRYEQNMATDKITYREIFFTILVKLLPVLVLIVLAYRAARREIPVIAAMPADLTDFVFILLVFLAVYLIAGNLVLRLLRENKPRASDSDGAA